MREIKILMAMRRPKGVEEMGTVLGLSRDEIRTVARDYVRKLTDMTCPKIDLGRCELAIEIAKEYLGEHERTWAAKLAFGIAVGIGNDWNRRGLRGAYNYYAKAMRIAEDNGLEGMAKELRKKFFS